MDGGRIALQLREDSHLWSLPGGAVEPGESLAEAAVRKCVRRQGWRCN
jgi:8-oxo-dGTP pyrophosphatase MutT (NUDIX family)